MPVSELSIADVSEAIHLRVVPPMSKLRLPHEGERALDLVGDELADDVARVDVDGANRHDLLTVAARQRTQQKGNLKFSNVLIQQFSTRGTGTHGGMQAVQRGYASGSLWMGKTK